MKICIAGGGKVGFYLAQSLLAHRHKITVIEPVEEQCRVLANSLDIPVVCGDCNNMDTLRLADCGDCDAFVAVTGSDEDNLVACQLAKKEFGVKRTVARASNPKNRELLHLLGVDTVVCGTDNLSHILEREIETETIRQLLSLGGGTASLNEILLPESFKYAGMPIREIPIPGDAILVSVTRDTDFIIPHGNTVLLPWDRILCLTQDSTLHLLIEEWGLSSSR
jgi:trk system potassium uptake protein TrkA